MLLYYYYSILSIPRKNKRKEGAGLAALLFSRQQEASVTTTSPCSRAVPTSRTRTRPPSAFTSPPRACDRLLSLAVAVLFSRLSGRSARGCLHKCTSASPRSSKIYYWPRISNRGQISASRCTLFSYIDRYKPAVLTRRPDLSLRRTCNSSSSNCLVFSYSMH